MITIKNKIKIRIKQFFLFYFVVLLLQMKHINKNI